MLTRLRQLPNLFLLMALLAQVALYPLLQTQAHGKAALAAVEQLGPVRSISISPITLTAWAAGGIWSMSALPA